MTTNHDFSPYQIERLERERLQAERWWASHMRARFGENWKEEAKRRGLSVR